MRRHVPTLTLLLATTLSAQAAPFLQGRIVDVLGDPVPVAVIQAVVDGVVVARTTSDGEGVYHLGRAPMTRAELRIRAAGKAELRLPWRGYTSPRIRNFTLEDACRLHGNVTDATGVAVAGATVVVIAGLFSAETKSDAKGAYDFRAVPFRHATVRATTRGGFAEQCTRLLGDTRCDLALPALTRGARVVRVKGLPAEAMPTAHVELTSSDMTRMGNGARVPLRADGTAEVSPTQACLVHLSAPGFTATPLGYLVTGGESPIEFEVVPCTDTHTKLAGRVVSGRNRPIVDYRLIARDRSHREVGTTMVGDDGRFTLTVDLPPRTICRFGLELRDWQLVGENATIADGYSWISSAADPEMRLELSVEAMSRAHSELRLVDGERLAFAEVIVADPARPYRALVQAVSDRAGNVDIHLPIGSYEVLATTIDGRIARAHVSVTAGRDTPPYQWRLVPAGMIEGCVRDAQGQPLPGVEVFVASTILQEEGSARVSDRLACSVRTDRNGRYRCRGLGVGAWTVHAVDEPGIGVGAADVKKDTTTSVDLRRAP